DVQRVCTQGLNMFRTLAIWLAPVLPDVAERARRLFGEDEWTWQSAVEPLLGRGIGAYEPLLTRVEMRQVERMIEQSKQAQAAAPAAAKESPRVSIDDFMKIDLRVAKIEQAEAVEGADKLLRLTLDLGNGERRQVFAGIKSAYAPQDLVGRHVVAVANL